VEESDREQEESPEPEGGGAPRDGDDAPRPEGSGGTPGAEGREGDGGGDAVEDESEHLSEEIREELGELEELRDRHLRLAAEFENYRKRSRRQLDEARERAQADLSERLLDALDDLERVLETPPDATTVEALREGVEMVERKLRKELADAGLARMEAEGARFDPEVHEALLTTPAENPEENDVVSRVLINGYTFGDRVIRPARVEVKKYRPGEETEEDGSGDGGGG
jgi:molecular chaperone GrpE